MEVFFYKEDSEKLSGIEARIVFQKVYPLIKMLCRRVLGYFILMYEW